MPEIDRQILIERLLENENLTGDLEDTEAEWLLKWGIRQVEPLIRACDGPETAGERVNELMAVMHKVNRIVADRIAYTPEQLADDLAMLADTYSRALGSDRQGVDFTSNAGQLTNLAPGEALPFLVQLVSQLEPGNESS